MRIALTGVSGFIGRAIARRAKGAGHSVTGLVRAGSRRDGLEPLLERFVVGDQADESVWPALLEGADCVIHNSADWAALRDLHGLGEHLRSNLCGSIRLLDASAPRQFIFISTIAVHHDMRPRWAGDVDEDHPLRPNSYYGAYKAAVEAHLWAVHFRDGRNTCALRPCAVYGIDPNLERSHGFKMVKALRAGEAINIPGGGKCVHVDDVAGAAVTAIGRPDVAGRPFNLVDCYARWGDWAAWAAEILGIKARIDLSSPAQPKNMFRKDAARELGIRLDRGHEGIKAHLRELIAAMS